MRQDLNRRFRYGSKRTLACLRIKSREPHRALPRWFALKTAPHQTTCGGGSIFVRKALALERRGVEKCPNRNALRCLSLVVARVANFLPGTWPNQGTAPPSSNAS